MKCHACPFGNFVLNKEHKADWICSRHNKEVYADYSCKDSKQIEKEKKITRIWMNNYEHKTMVEIAKMCGISTHSLYVFVLERDLPKLSVQEMHKKGIIKRKRRDNERIIGRLGRPKK